MVCARMCVCLCVVSSSLCVSMMSVVSVSSTEGGVIADVLPPSLFWLQLPKAIGIQRGEASECRRLTDSTLSSTEESWSERIIESALTQRYETGDRLLEKCFCDVCAMSESSGRGEEGMSV